MNKPVSLKEQYTREELQRLTTLQLREICFKEKLVKGMSGLLDKEAFIETILRFRGADEDFLIHDYERENYDRLEKWLTLHLGQRLKPRYPIENPAKLTLYHELALEVRDQYKVLTREETIQASNVLLMDETNALCGILFLLPSPEKKGEFFLCKGASMPVLSGSNRKYRLLYFSQVNSIALYEQYAQKRKWSGAPVDFYEVPIHQVEIKGLPELDEALAIDFGTSNTTAGIYVTEENRHLFSAHDQLNGKIKVNAINYVQFQNLTISSKAWTELWPTVVGVANCENSSQIKFQYGYDALKHDQLSGGDELHSIFYELKRWVDDYGKLEEVTDYKGNIATVARKELIRGFLEDVIIRAQQQFKCYFKKLHISAPVKLKQQFLKMFQELLPDYELEIKDALDEGIAVLYNTISNQIKQQSFQNGYPYQALIMDCGGGTTDVSSCEFTVNDDHLSYQINIKTTFENGDTNFGGNNLTYRIMQYLKVLFVDYYLHKGRTLLYQDVMKVAANDAYRFLDEHGREALYESLTAIYNEAELLLPTKYQHYLNRSQSDYRRVKANYHLLWRLADEIKKQLFAETGLQQIRMKPASGLDETTGVIAPTSFRVSLLQQGELDYCYEIPDLAVHYTEMSHLIKGDIYYIIKKFLEPFYENDQLQNFSLIKMTGQSCRIHLFKDAMKEFIPGVQIEFKQQNSHVLDLKLSCLNGAVKYLQAKKTGHVFANIQNLTPILPYSIMAYTHHQQEHILLESKKKVTEVNGFISKPTSIKEMYFYLKDDQQSIQAKYLYPINIDTCQEITYEEINLQYPHIRQDDLDTIIENEIKFFVYAKVDFWGFYVLPIYRLNGLRMGVEKSYPFENEQWNLNFFDGLK